MAVVDAAARLRDDPECWGSGPSLEAWANTPEVKAALHVAPGVTFALCSNNFTFDYNSDMKDERAVVYPALTKQAGYRVVIYNGAWQECRGLWRRRHGPRRCARVALVYYARRRARSPWLPPQARPTFACPSRTTSGGRAP